MRLPYSLAVQLGYLADETTLVPWDFEYYGPPADFDRARGISLDM
jgi:hypothetical protein